MRYVHLEYIHLNNIQMNYINGFTHTRIGSKMGIKWNIQTNAIPLKVNEKCNRFDWVFV